MQSMGSTAGPAVRWGLAAILISVPASLAFADVPAPATHPTTAPATQPAVNDDVGHWLMRAAEEIGPLQDDELRARLAIDLLCIQTIATDGQDLDTTLRLIAEAADGPDMTTAHANSLCWMASHFVRRDLFAKYQRTIAAACSIEGAARERDAPLYDLRRRLITVMVEAEDDETAAGLVNSIDNEAQQAWVRALLADKLIRAGRVELGREHMAQAKMTQVHDPGDRAVLTSRLINCHTALQEFDQAIALAIGLPDAADVVSELTYIAAEAFKQKRLEIYRSSLDRAIEMIEAAPEPDQFDMYIDAAEFLAEMGDSAGYQHLLMRAEPAMRHLPEDEQATAWADICYVHEVAGNIEQAEQIHIRAGWRPYVGLGLLYVKAGRLEDARMAFASSERSFVGWNDLYQAFNWLAHHGQLATAVAWLEEMDDPTDRAHACLGIAHGLAIGSD